MPLRGELEPGRRIGALHQIFHHQCWAVACVTRSRRFDTMPSRPMAQAWRNTAAGKHQAAHRERKS